MATKINSSDEWLILTLAWYCSRITWPGNSGSGMAENCLMITRSVWSPASRSSSLWSVAAINAMRTRSPRWRTRKSERNGWEISEVWDIQKHKPSKSPWGLTSGLVQASFLSKRHVKVSGVSGLALCYDATHTLHGETTCGWAQCCEWATRLRPGSEGRGVIIFARVCVFILLFRLQWGTTILTQNFNVTDANSDPLTHNHQVLSTSVVFKQTDSFASFLHSTHSKQASMKYFFFSWPVPSFFWQSPDSIK